MPKSWQNKKKVKKVLDKLPNLCYNKKKGIEIATHKPFKKS